VALNNGEGFLKVTGEVGLGKTLLCRKLLNALNEPYVTAYIPNPHLSPGAMRQAIVDDLGIATNINATQNDIVRAMTRKLIELARAGKRVVVVLDEAQELPEKTLEAVRLLTNLETEKRKLLQIVLFGQPELDRRLQLESLRQLRQRITFSYTLAPLDEDGLKNYVRHRLHVAGLRGGNLFDGGALKKIFHASRGTPRLVNILCHKALMAAYGRGLDRVDARHAALAVRDTEGARQLRMGWLPFLVGAPLAAVALLSAWFARGLLP
ncbi:MAG TPA: AAA family ATPase, partial [Gammaproteobacteria bacterium]